MLALVGAGCQLWQQSLSSCHVLALGTAGSWAVSIYRSLRAEQSFPWSGEQQEMPNGWRMSICSHSPCAEPGHTRGPALAPFPGDTPSWKGHRVMWAARNSGHPAWHKGSWSSPISVVSDCTALLQTPLSHGNDPPAHFLSIGLALQHCTRSRDLAGARTRVQLPVQQE